MILFPPELIISQVAAMATLPVAILVVQKKEPFTERYGLAYRSILGFILCLEVFLVPMVDIDFYESLIEGRLTKDGAPTAARIISVLGRTGRRHGGHGAPVYAVRCEYSLNNGQTVQGEVRVAQSKPPVAGDSVSVRYLPNDPSVVREEAALGSPEVSTWLAASLLWILNGFWISVLTIRGNRPSRQNKRDATPGRDD